jgi:hypothetical protein
MKKLAEMLLRSIQQTVTSASMLQLPCREEYRKEIEKNLLSHLLKFGPPISSSFPGFCMNSSTSNVSAVYRTPYSMTRADTEYDVLTDEDTTFSENRNPRSFLPAEAHLVSTPRCFSSFEVTSKSVDSEDSDTTVDSWTPFSGCNVSLHAREATDFDVSTAHIATKMSYSDERSGNMVRHFSKNTSSSSIFERRGKGSASFTSSTATAAKGKSLTSEDLQLR